MLSFLLRKLRLVSFTFNLQFLHELSKVLLSNTVYGIFHFRFRLFFIQAYNFVQQNAWTL